MMINIFEAIEPDYEFDARMVVRGRMSPLCSVKLWLPIDCHTDAKIEIVGPANPQSSDFIPHDSEDLSGPDRLISEIDAKFGLEIEAVNVLFSNMSSKPSQKVLGFSASISHIGRLLIKQKFGDKKCNIEKIYNVAFHLSSVNYAKPFTTPTVDYLGNRDSGVMEVREFYFHSRSEVLRFTMERYWRWLHGKHERLCAASTPVLVLHNSEVFTGSDFSKIEQIGRDVSTLLTLAARHLVAVHKVVYSLDGQSIQEWFSPLDLQRSTTEEAAYGPLVDENLIDEFFRRASIRWQALDEIKKDAVRLAIYSINPFVSTSTEARYLRMFSSLEGLANAWFPDIWNTHKKIKALVKIFTPDITASWHLTDGNKDSLKHIRNHLAHGKRLKDECSEALLIGTDHLQVWIERILLNILDFKNFYCPRDWLTVHVSKTQEQDLHRLQERLRDTS